MEMAVRFFEYTQRKLQQVLKQEMPIIIGCLRLIMGIHFFRVLQTRLWSNMWSKTASRTGSGSIILAYRDPSRWFDNSDWEAAACGIPS